MCVYVWPLNNINFYVYVLWSDNICCFLFAVKKFRVFPRLLSNCETFRQIFATLCSYMALYKYFKPDKHWSGNGPYCFSTDWSNLDYSHGITVPRIVIFSCTFYWFVHQLMVTKYPCKCENLGCNFQSQRSQDSSSLTINTYQHVVCLYLMVIGDVHTWILWKLVKAGNHESFSGNEGEDVK